MDYLEKIRHQISDCRDKLNELEKLEHKLSSMNLAERFVYYTEEDTELGWSGQHAAPFYMFHVLNKLFSGQVTSFYVNAHHPRIVRAHFIDGSQAYFTEEKKWEILMENKNELD